MRSQQFSQFQAIFVWESQDESINFLQHFTHKIDHNSQILYYNCTFRVGMCSAAVGPVNAMGHACPPFVLHARDLHE